MLLMPLNKLQKFKNSNGLEDSKSTTGILSSSTNASIGEAKMISDLCDQSENPESDQRSNLKEQEEVQAMETKYLANLMFQTTQIPYILALANPPDLLLITDTT